MNTKILCSGTMLLAVYSAALRLVGSVDAPVYFVGSIVLGTIWLAVTFK